jgi:hypothetical protein
MPSNACFANVNSIGVPRLRRVLRALAWLYPEIGYCQGTGMVSCPSKQGVYPRPSPVLLVGYDFSLQGSRMGGKGSTWESTGAAASVVRQGPGAWNAAGLHLQA